MACKDLLLLANGRAQDKRKYHVVQTLVLYERKVDVPRFKVLKNRLYCKRDKVSRISKFAYWDVFVREGEVCVVK